MKPWERLAIKPSAYISGFCYSIFRLEPWSTCRVACIYCYAAWYRGPPGEPRPEPESLRVFAKTARRLARVRGPPPFFRMATLSEPLQDPEPRLPFAYRFARVALRQGIPLVINTKLPSRLLAEPWRSLVGELSDRRLALIQVSLSLDDYHSLLLEPGAESASTRLTAIRGLLREGIPVVVRLQPLIPGLERVHERLLTELASIGVKSFIGESIRLSRREAIVLEKLLGLDYNGWEPYELHRAPGREGLIHPPRRWRLEVHKRLYSIAEGLSARYTACKEGLLAHKLPGDCCHASQHLDYILLRPTLLEALAYRRERGSWPGIGELCEYARSLSDAYVCGPLVNHYPNPVAKALRLHERRLGRLLSALREGRIGEEWLLGVLQ